MTSKAQLKKAVEELVEELVEAKGEYQTLTSDEDPDPPKLGKPCSAAQLAALERIVGQPLPPSYRAFMELHNGWHDFDGTAAILAVEDHKSEWVKERLKLLRDTMKEFGDKDPFDAGAVPVVLDENTPQYVVLDPRKARPDGEMTFVSYEYAKKEGQWKDFTAYLKSDLKVTRELIKDEKQGKDDED
jgi:hypothetical protein